MLEAVTNDEDMRKSLADQHHRYAQERWGMLVSEPCSDPSRILPHPDANKLSLPPPRMKELSLL